MKKQIAFRDGTISYFSAGTGIPVLLIHGFGEDSSIWDNQVLFLQQSCKIIAVDLPGAGGSSIFTNENVEISDFADAVKAVINAEGITSVLMIGHSMGGYISLAFQKKYPNELIGLGLIHSTANADSETKKIIRKKSISFIRKNGVTPFFETAIPGLFHDKHKNKTAIKSIIGKSNQFRDNTLIQCYEAVMNRPSSIEILQSLSLPLLIIGGKHDEIISLKDILWQSQLSNQTHLYILKHSAHMGMIEETQEMNDILRVFLEYLLKI